MFQFKLQTLLNYRRQREETFQQEFAEIKQTWEEQRETLKKYHDQWKECIDGWRSIQNESLSILEISLYQKYMLRLKHEIIQQADKVKDCLQKMDKMREILLSARKDKKIIEKLQENHLNEYRMDQLKKEKKFLDEVATQRFNLKGIIK